MNELGFAIVGCGVIAPFHARAVGDLPNAALKAVHTGKPDKAKKMLDDLGPAFANVSIHTDLSELLARPDVHVVNICTPSGAHLDPALAAAAAGKHVVVEKPLEITLRRCDQILDACRAAGVQLCTIFPSRFGDANQELKTAIDAGRFGKLTLGDTTVKWWRPQSYYDDGAWRGTWNLDGGGALMNQAIHNVDLIQSLLGPVAEVAAFTSRLAHERIEVEDTAVAAVRFANGALGTITATTSVYPGLLKTIAIHGDKGSVVIEQDQILRWEFAEPDPRDDEIRTKYAKTSATTGGASDPKAISYQGHARQLADFVAAVRTNTQPRVTGSEGRKAVEIILAIYESQTTGRTV
ncbi:MAG: Gfo/Idh/MocA family protein, partial [Planctomycetia bacterium]